MIDKAGRRSLGTESTEGAIIGFIGYLLLLVGGVLVLFTAVSKSRFSNFICIIAGVAMLLGSIFVFSIKGAYLDANSMNAAKDYIKLTFAPVLAGVLGILGCVGAAGAAVAGESGDGRTAGDCIRTRTAGEIRHEKAPTPTG